MEVSNASLYDGASAVAEAALMAGGANRSRIAAHSRADERPPHYRKMALTTAGNQDSKRRGFRDPPAKGVIATTWLARHEGEAFTALVIPQPNFFGVLEHVDALTDWGMRAAPSWSPPSIPVPSPS